MTEPANDTTEKIGAGTGAVVGTAVAGLSGAEIRFGLSAIGGTVVASMVVIAGSTVLLASEDLGAATSSCSGGKATINEPNQNDDNR